MRAVPLDGAVHFHQTEPVSMVTPPCIGSPGSRVAATFVPVAEVVQPESAGAAEKASFDGAAPARVAAVSVTRTPAIAASAASLPPTPNVSPRRNCLAGSDAPCVRGTNPIAPDVLMPSAHLRPCTRLSFRDGTDRRPGPSRRHRRGGASGPRRHDGRRELGRPGADVLLP